MNKNTAGQTCIYIEDKLWIFYPLALIRLTLRGVVISRDLSLAEFASLSQTVGC